MVNFIRPADRSFPAETAELPILVGSFKKTLSHFIHAGKLALLSNSVPYKQGSGQHIVNVYGVYAEELER